MSVSDVSTLLSSSREQDGSYQCIDGYAYGRGGLEVNTYQDSPYSDSDIAILDIGPKPTRFYIHRVLLSQSLEFDAFKASTKLWGEKPKDNIALPEIDEPTAHTLVHYLYTGKYQTLVTHDLTKDGSIPGYKLGTCVYCAAIRYKLPGLAELARQKITSFGEELSVLDILRITRDHAFPALPEEEVWFTTYLNDAVTAAYMKDQSLFLSPEFMDLLDADRKFRQVVMKAVLGAASKVAATASEAPTGVSSPQPAPSIQEPIAEEDIAEGEAATIKISEDKISEVAPAANHKRSDSAVMLASPKEDITFEDIEPVVETPAEPEPASDELGYSTSSTYRKFGKKVEQPLDQPISGAPNPGSQLDDTASVLDPGQETTADNAESTLEPQPHTATSEPQTTGLVLEVPPQVLRTPVEEEAAVEASTSTSSKVTNEPVQMPNALPEAKGPIPEAVEPAQPNKKSKKKKGKKKGSDPSPK